ncbi:MAG: hypothetical protein IPK66_18065 [Rhodospirillales bacterium]|nr:hypothetical protein [Rhodospirillales bacterium]
MTLTCGFRTAALAIALAISVPVLAKAQGAGALVPLPAAMQQAATKYLPGVVGDPVPAFPIDPDLAMLRAGERTYAIVSGADAGTTEQHVITPVAGDKTGRQWRYQVGDRAVYLQDTPGKSLTIVSEADGDQGVLTRYNPPEPMLIAGMNAGDSKHLKMKVKVYDISDPDDLEHEGALDVTLTYVGAYKVTVPAGTFDAALLRWDFEGTVGPATVKDIQGRFVAPGVGMVAAAEHRNVAAFFVYNDDTKVGKVLATAP